MPREKTVGDKITPHPRSKSSRALRLIAVVIRLGGHGVPLCLPSRYTNLSIMDTSFGGLELFAALFYM